MLTDSGRIPLSSYQRRNKKIHDWKIRRVLRVVQARTQANKNADCLRRDFWSEAVCVADKMDRSALEEQRIEEELLKRRKIAVEIKRKADEDAVRLLREEEEFAKMEKKRTVEFYATQAKERFQQALRKEQEQRTLADAPSTLLSEHLKEHRRKENQLAHIRREHFRQSNLPVETKHIKLVRRDSMQPREGIPAPHIHSRPDSGNISALTLTSSPSSVKEPPVGFPKHFPPGGSGIKLLSRDLGDTASLGTIISLNKENLVPVSAREEPTVTDPTWLHRNASEMSPRDSVHSLDSEIVRNNLKIRAVQLSPPKQPRNVADDIRRRPRVSPMKKSPSSSPRKLPPFSPSKRIPFRQVQNDEIASRSPRNVAEDQIRPGAIDVMAELRQVMDALNILDRYLPIPGISADSFTMSVSSGPLSSADDGHGQSLSDSWLSQQTLSADSSQHESGVLFTNSSFSLTSNRDSSQQQSFSILSEGNLNDTVSECTFDLS